ncbi:hypothetical protein [Brevundimonas sp. Root1423]|uniref:hypothetical protein n=1 Tax=Brevundimonas sp. Root1423 TaxID=1736462 RepID=UPI0006F27CF2|nr:hypothetical protein [Brevundimonas sp. Root1423]KQY85027.1 hypothetical protein ASD25_08535 [Brevundimonas sp. Root1423]
MIRFAPAFAALGLSLAVATPAAAQMREYPITTPVPAGAVELSAGVYPREGQVVLQDNMPGHRRFKAPLFPNAGWDSPVRADGEKDYDRYLIEYWRAPSLSPTELNPAYPGQEQRGYVSPGPHAAQIARSAATAAEDALFERRMQFITEQLLASTPLRNLHGASLEPLLTVAGYGEAHGGRGDGVMRGEIALELDVIAPWAGVTERMPDGTIKSSYSGPTLRIHLNPAFINCAGPSRRTGGGVDCARSDGRLWLNTQRDAVMELGQGAEAVAMLNDGLYADRRPATDLRAVFVQHDRNGRAASDISRGRMHPHDPLGRVIGAMNLVDWDDLLSRAAQIQ